ncbi:hypothetical protein ICL16_29485 [Iningainema sp. BLCCT55]|uniref:Uncharacterized protein n=2 Tax=Iningainema TaxID=1932705 RepID=A0A8J6XN61_9CYAN|nr:hypothetical protein [Iningainema tapete]MBD2776081.1 hypothetical protein [Iningainema tapete BLCC-T55]
MTLPTELERDFKQELNNYEESRRMPYITSIERSGIRQGLLKGIELGLKLKFGSEGLGILPEISVIEDINLLQAILEGLSLIPEISYIQDLEQLRAILAGLETVSTVEELRQIDQNTTV